MVKPFAEIHKPGVCGNLQELTSSVQVDLGAATQQTTTQNMIINDMKHGTKEPDARYCLRSSDAGSVQALPDSRTDEDVGVNVENQQPCERREQYHY